MLTDVIVLLLVAMAVIGVIKSIRKQKKSGPAEVAAVPAPGVADAAVSITIQLRKLTKPERMGV